MKEYMDQLSKCVLFKDIKDEEILNILDKSNYEVAKYYKDELIAIEGEVCHSICIILKGKVEIQKVFPSGQVMTINIFKEGNIFGESLVFSDKHTYPATITAMEYTEIMFIKREDIIKISMLNSNVLTNFVSVLSHRILMLNNRITNLSQDTIRKKISNYLLDEYKIQNTTLLSIPFTRKRMAELLNIPRPSLSRELINMKEEGIIDYDRNTIKILKMESLEKALFD